MDIILWKHPEKPERGWHSRKNTYKYGRADGRPAVFCIVFSCCASPCFASPKRQELLFQIVSITAFARSSVLRLPVCIAENQMADALIVSFNAG